MLKRISSYFDIQATPPSASDIRKYSRIPRFTYRTNFPPIASLTTDSGWGCCFRSAQGLVASFLLKYSAEEPEFYFERFPKTPLLGLFEDHKEMPFSIQNLVDVCSNYGVAPGNWARPSQIAVTVQSVLSKNRIDSIIPIDSNINTSDLDNISYPALLMMPVMLGLDSVDPKFYPFLRFIFNRKEFVGIVSGHSCYSYYFVGMTEKEDCAIYFDPHVTREAVLSNENHEDFFSQPAKSMFFKSMNPSMLIGLLCVSKDKARAMIDDIVSFENSPILANSIDMNLVDQVMDIDDLDF